MVTFVQLLHRRVYYKYNRRYQSKRVFHFKIAAFRLFYLYVPHSSLLGCVCGLLDQRMDIDSLSSLFAIEISKKINNSTKIGWATYSPIYLVDFVFILMIFLYYPLDNNKKEERTARPEQMHWMRLAAWKKKKSRARFWEMHSV